MHRQALRPGVRHRSPEAVVLVPLRGCPHLLRVRKISGGTVWVDVLDGTAQPTPTPLPLKRLR